MIVGTSTNYFWNGTNDAAWNTTSPGTNFLNAVNGGTDPGTLPGAADTVTFNTTTANTANLSTTLGQNFSINALNFGAGNNNANSVSVDVGSSTLTLNAGGITQAAGSAANSIVATGAGGVSLLATQAWTNNSANNLTVSAPISGAGGLVINGTGTGSVILSGANSYTGGTTVTAANAGTGKLQLGSPTALGAATNALVTNAFGNLDLNGQSVTVGSLAGNGGTITNSTGASTFTVNQAATTTYAGIITDGAGTVALVKNGPGTLILDTTALASTTTAGSATVTLVTGTTASLFVGETVASAFIPAGDNDRHHRRVRRTLRSPPARV